MRRRLARIGLGAALLALVAAVVVVSGVVPIAASSGHWKVTAALLHFTMQRSVATHSLGAPAPPELAERRLILMGAGHYEGGCRPCHGSPGDEMPEVARHMTPAPPWLPDRTGDYDDRELFYIIRHGVKFTGMPAWSGANREDEVWALVAFARELQSLDAAGYRRWVRGDEDTVKVKPKVPEVVRGACARCHGVAGRGRGEGAFPRLAGQRRDYLLASLEAYARGSRHSGIMQPIAVTLDEEERRAAADWYASREPVEHSYGERGAAIAREGIAERRIPACAHCHGPGHEPHHASYPLLDGQYPAYLEQQLHLFVRGVRGGSAYAEVMHDVAAHDLSPEEMADVAAFYGAARRAR